MSEANFVEVIDRDGWRKEFPLQKAILHIGSDPRNDLVLEGARGRGVAARHLQLISVGNGPGYRLMNIGDSEVRLGQAGASSLAPRAFVEIGPGEQVRVGEFTLTFHGGPRAAAGLGRDTTSRSIGLTLALPSAELLLGKPLDGTVTVRNQGDKTGVQFKLEADGLDPACIEIGPGPILFPNAEKEVAFRLHHPRAARPPAGDYRFRIRATAPAAYPGESATASQLIKIGPYYSHKLQLVVAG